MAFQPLSRGGAAGRLRKLHFLSSRSTKSALVPIRASFTLIVARSESSSGFIKRQPPGTALGMHLAPPPPGCALSLSIRGRRLLRPRLASRTVFVLTRARAKAHAWARSVLPRRAVATASRDRVWHPGIRNIAGRILQPVLADSCSLEPRKYGSFIGLGRYRSACESCALAPRIAVHAAHLCGRTLQSPRFPAHGPDSASGPIVYSLAVCGKQPARKHSRLALRREMHRRRVPGATTRGSTPPWGHWSWGSGCL